MGREDLNDEDDFEELETGDSDDDLEPETVIDVSLDARRRLEERLEERRLQKMIGDLDYDLDE